MAYIKKNFTCVLLLMTFDQCKGSILSSSSTNYKIIRSNATSYTIEDVESQEDLEYPGNNNQIFKMVQQMWANYYWCLHQSKNNEKKPEIKRLLEGQHTEFQCNICAKPFQNYDEIEWKYKPLSLESNIHDAEHLDLTSEMTLTGNKTLRIFNVKIDFAGLYVCYQKKNVISVYILEISRNDTTERVTTSCDTKETFIKLDRDFFQIHYQWTEWTECSSCGKVGRRFKYGSCFVSPKTGISVRTSINSGTQDLNKSISRRSLEFFENKNIFKGKLFLINKTLENGIYQNLAIETIKKFSTGIPCTSQYLPRTAQVHTQKLKQQIQAECHSQETCEEYQIFEVFDSYGRLIEVANNSEGIYSVLQKLPSLPPDVERRFVTADFGKDIIIQCPGTLLSSIPITWKINNEVIFPEIIAYESRGRFIIDLVNRIQIKKLRLKDSHIYSCWQKSRLVGTVHLNVEKKFNIAFNHHVTLLGMIIIIATMLSIGTKVITKELKNRKK